MESKGRSYIATVLDKDFKIARIKKKMKHILLQVLLITDQEEVGFILWGKQRQVLDLALITDTM